MLWLLALITILSAVGVVLRHRGNQEPSRDSMVLKEGLDGVRRRIRDHLGGKTGTLVDGAVHFRQGLGREAVTLVVIGALAIGISAAAGRTLGYNARLEVLPGATLEESLVRSTRWDGMGWVEARPTMGMTCDTADPQDSRRARSCLAMTGEGEVPVTLGMGTGVNVGAMRLTTLRERPAARSGEPQLLITFPGERAKRLRAEHGKSYVLKDGSRVTAWRGGTGPVAVVFPPGDGRPELHVPSVDRRGDGALTLSGVPRVTVEVGIEHAPQTALLWCGALFLLLGLGLFGGLAELRVVAQTTETGTLVMARSWNRGQLAERFISQLGEAPVAEDTGAEP